MRMLRCGAWIAWLVIAVGCAPSLQSMSAGQIGCKAGDIRISDDHSGWGEQTWTATCDGRRYSCSKVQTGSVGTFGTSSYGTVSQVSCSAMSDGRSYASARSSGGERSAPARMPGGTGSAKVERVFDEKRELHVVRGTFGLAPGVQLRFVGVPQVKLGTLAVVLDGRWPGAPTTCAGLQVLVNEQPFSSEENTAKDLGGGKFNLESRFDFQTFKGLTQQFSTFGVRACPLSWKLSEAQLTELQKFFVIYSQLAIQVQNGELPSKEGKELDAPAATEAPAPVTQDGV